MAVTVLLVRHAEHVEFERVLSGRRPGVALSARGERQAERLARRLAVRGLDRVEASPLERAQATAAAIGAACGRPVATSPALLELDFGEWTGRALAGFGDDPAWAAWNARRATARAPGGESMAEAQARVVARLAALAREADGAVVALVSHADLIRAAVCWALGLSLDKLLRFAIAPASVSRLEVAAWGASVQGLNETTDD